MTLTSSRSFGQVKPVTAEDSNSSTQRKLYQLLSIIEPILLNDENVVKAINNGFVDTLSEMLIFQSQNLQNMQKNIIGHAAEQERMQTP